LGAHPLQLEILSSLRGFQCVMRFCSVETLLEAGDQAKQSKYGRNVENLCVIIVTEVPGAKSSLLRGYCACAA